MTKFNPGNPDLWLAVGTLAHQTQGLTVKPIKSDAVCIV